MEFFFFNRDRKFYDSPILFIFNLNKNFGNTLPNIPFSLKTNCRYVRQFSTAIIIKIYFIMNNTIDWIK